jgi:hypothetical protein
LAPLALSVWCLSTFFRQHKTATPCFYHAFT